MRRRLLLLGIFLSMTLTAWTSPEKADSPQSYYKYSQELPLSAGN
jgi:hypothetical protein